MPVRLIYCRLLKNGIMCRQSKTGTCGNECLAGFVMFELLEVVDEHLGKLGSLFVPDSGIGIGVARIEDIGVNAGKFGRHLSLIHI